MQVVLGLALVPFTWTEINLLVVDAREAGFAALRETVDNIIRYSIMVKGIG